MGGSDMTPAAVSQALDDLDTLIAEATEARKALVGEACKRVQACLQSGIHPTQDDALIVMQFIGQRTAQNRYGQ